MRCFSEVIITNNNNREDLNTTKAFDVRKLSQNPKSAVPRQTSQGAVRQSARPAQAQRPVPSAQAQAQQRQYQAQRQMSASAPTRTIPTVRQNVNSQGVQNNTQRMAETRNISTVQQSAQRNSASQTQRQATQGQTRPVQQAAQRQAQTAQPRSAQPSQATRAASAQTQTIPAAKTNKKTVDTRMLKTRVDAVDREEQKKAQEKRDKRKEAAAKKKSSSEGVNTVVSIIKAILYIIFVIVISVFLAIAIIKVGNDVFAFVKSTEEVEVTIPENATTEDIANILAENDVIKYPKVFKLYANVRHYDDDYVAGTYTVTPSTNYDFLITEFKEKSVVGTVDITIPEGFTTDEIIDLFVSAGIGTREGFIDVIQNGDFDYWFIDQLEENGENPSRIYRLDGYLFPDTYQFYLASSEWTVINKLLRRFSQIFTKEYRAQCDELGYTVDEIMTLASIIEKEAASSSEFFLVSSVFHNRLNASWAYPRFESDATVVYAIEHETGERVIDLTYDSAYNTYLYDGFPPGPIANPSASAILAALSPLETNYYYFISNNNVTYFSTSKAEHQAYIEQFKNETVQQTTGDVPNN